MHPPGAPLLRPRGLACVLRNAPIVARVIPMAHPPSSRRHIDAVGHIEGRFPSLSIEKEFAQKSPDELRRPGKHRSTGAARRAVPIRQPYLVRHLVLGCFRCRGWRRTSCGLATRRISIGCWAIRSQPHSIDLDVVVGLRGSIASSDECDGSMLPLVTVDADLIPSIGTRCSKGSRKPAGSMRRSRAAAEEVFSRILQLTDNAGSTPEHRALSYLAMRYPGIYVRAAERFASDFSHWGRDAAIDARRRPPIVDVYFVFTNRNTDFTERYLVRVDVTDCFPFLVSELAPSFERSGARRKDTRHEHCPRFNADASIGSRALYEVGGLVQRRAATGVVPARPACSNCDAISTCARNGGEPPRCATPARDGQLLFGRGESRRALPVRRPCATELSAT